MNIKTSLLRGAGAALALLAAAACSDETSTVPMLARAQVNLEASSLNAGVGDHVAIALHVDRSMSLAGIQGAIHFDPSRLAYDGQVADDQAIAIVNEQDAANGALRFGSFKPGGIGQTAVTFVFTVKAAGYTHGLSYVNEAAASNSQPVTRVAIEAGALELAPALRVDGAQHLTARDWVARLGITPNAAVISARPGEQHPGLQFGDVQYDGFIDGLDYVDVANTAVGNRTLIVNTDGPAPTPDVDRVIAANVAPQTGGVCGVESDGSRVLDVLDYVAIANEVVGNFDNPCVGSVIPGRENVARPDTVLFGSANGDTAVKHVVTGTLHLTNNRVWLFDGIIDVQAGGQLIIDPGTTIKGDSLGGIYIERGGHIIADGTFLQPIVMTCQQAEPKTRGCWRGLFIAGRAHVNAANTGLGAGQAPGCPAGTLQALGEGNGPVYGGCDDADSSGVVRYVRFEYGGRTLSDGNENNNLTLGGVGNKTVIDYVQVHRGQDDGVEFFGGSVNVKHLVSTANFDDQFDWSFGYNGDAQFVIIQVDNANNNGDTKGLEGDNSEPPGDANNPLSNNELPRTAPNLYNFTVIGNLATLGTGPGAIHVRRGNGSHLANFIVMGWPIGLQMTDASTCSTFGGTQLSMKSMTFVSVANLGNDDADPEFTANPGICPTPASQGLAAGEWEEAFLNAEPSNRNLPTTSPTDILVAPYDIFLPDWRMKTTLSGDPVEGNTQAPPSGHPFIEATNYRGAVAPAATAGGIPWYSGWTRPWQSLATP